MENIQLIATATFGLESIVAKELKYLGYKNVMTKNGYVEFDAQIKDICKTNINLRCAERVFLKLAEFKAHSFEELYQNVKNIDWKEILPIDAVFPISKVSSVKSKLFSKSDIQSISKKAIVDRMSREYNVEKFSETGEEYPIKVQILKNNVIVSIDTSGEGLHKRGYRGDNRIAAIKETLAAGLVKIARWEGKRPLLDLTCGTGTILIEAAMIARNMAPGVNRRFVSEKWHIVPEKYWISERDNAYSKEIESDVKIMGFDIDKKSIEAAKQNAENAEVKENIIFINKDLNQFENIDNIKNGALISNPPYGDRLLDKTKIKKLYKDLAKVIKNEIPDWSYYIITSDEEFEDTFNKKSDKNRKLYNGGIKCYYYQYFGRLKK